MDSEDEVLQYINISSEEEEDDHNLIKLEPQQQQQHSSNDKHYKILTQDDIKRLQQNLISTVSTALSVSMPTACTFLCRNNWNLDFDDECFTNTENNAHHYKPPSTDTILCNICFETIPIENMLSTSTCDHLFCTDCWQTYLSVSILDGLRCLTLHCPGPKCKSYVGFDMFDSLSPLDDKDKYYRYLYQSYVESNPRRKWCPSPAACGFVIELDNGESFDVTCRCGYMFCWNCSRERHSPLDCETVSKWMEKNSSEARNTNWIIANTKPCPKCCRAIEKNQGCNQMMCRDPCRYIFCWACLGPWTDHTHYNCNRYKKVRDSADERSLKRARMHLERYSHYYERWDANDRSMKRAMVDVKAARDVHVDVLVEVQGETRARLAFVVEAWDQIVECRRVLKWTYAYGYYVSSGKRDFFEHLQGRAEWALERLHHCVEKEMRAYMLAEGLPTKLDFEAFRAKVVNLTSLTRTYFENLSRALGNNLSEVEDGGNKTREGSEDEETFRTKSRRRQR